MKAGRELAFVLVVFIFFVLACNLPLPGSTTGGGEPAAVVSPGVTYVVVVENTSTAIPADTPIPATATPQVQPELTLTKNSNCRLGPSTYYNVVDQIASGSVMPVIGRSEKSDWWQIVNNTGRECWVFMENATPNQDFSSLAIGEAPPLPGIPLNFVITDQLCQPGPKKFSVAMSWSSGGGETAFRVYRDGNRIGEYKPSRLTYKDTNAPYNKNLVYEVEAVNENGTSERATQIVPACK
ncbi:MAG: SH3 domain-containing protein [Anaerolineales bacterium]|uniref:SH3 domain-containing protein n=1 Tax=Candidatus Villigracilis vicinus TaxID=3140679 RepID=UPI0031346F0E|nr:SH3 domain-containing protein [Anaerolineales bacterium]MBK9778920.1 SH3 domain-containing protein [Anaerolineales bacterium]